MPVYPPADKGYQLASQYLPSWLQPGPSDASAMAAPLGIASEAGGGLMNLLGKLWGKKAAAPLVQAGMPSAMRAADPLFTPEENAAMGEVQRIYQNYFGVPVQLGAETRMPEMEPARRYLGQYKGAVTPDVMEHIRNAYMAGMRHANNLRGVK